MDTFTIINLMEPNLFYIIFLIKMKYKNDKQYIDLVLGLFLGN